MRLNAPPLCLKSVRLPVFLCFAAILSSITSSGLSAAATVEPPYIGGNVNLFDMPNTLPGIPAQPAEGRPSSFLWMSPSDIRIYKVRGASRDIQDLDAYMLWLSGQPDRNNPPSFMSQIAPPEGEEPSIADVPFHTWSPVQGSGKLTIDGYLNVPYESSQSDYGNSVNRIEDRPRVPGYGTSPLRGAITDSPYDAGLTRYEMWLRHDGDGQGRTPRWFFNSYNIVHQGGEIAGTLSVQTADPVNNRDSSTVQKTFRNAPYLVVATESSEENRTYTARRTTSEEVRLYEEPKFLTLSSPSRDGVIGTRLPTRATLAESELSRTYMSIEAASSQFSSDLGRRLAPNVSISDEGVNFAATAGAPVANSPLAKNWQLSEDTWTFSQWQRGETADMNAQVAPITHYWGLETKEDVLFAPQVTPDLETTNLGPAAYKLTEGTSASLITGMVVASAQVTAYDTGGMRVAAAPADALKTYTTFDDIPEYASVSFLPVGTFYPSSIVLATVEYRILDENNQPEGDWSTTKVRFWVADSAAGSEIALGTTSSAAFDPYTEGLIFPLRDLSQPSAEYRIRIFKALPFAEIDPNPSTTEVSDRVAHLPSVLQGDTFNATGMESVLNINNSIPVIGNSEAIARALSLATLSYQRALTRVGLNSSSDYAGIPSLRLVGNEVVEAILSRLPSNPSPNDGTVGGMSATVGLGITPSAITAAQIANYFGAGQTLWVEYSFTGASGAPISWKVESTPVDIGADPEAAAIIVTE